MIRVCLCSHCFWNFSKKSQESLFYFSTLTKFIRGEFSPVQYEVNDQSILNIATETWIESLERKGYLISTESSHDTVKVYLTGVYPHPDYEENELFLICIDFDDHFV